jgi:chromosome segregation ATPase
LVEQAIFSCVGFLLAALLAVAAAPAVSRRARRLAEARARLLAPLSEAQAIADRDALRAEHAVERLRLVQRLSAVEDIAARRLIEVGRHAARVLALEDDIAALPREAFEAAKREAEELRAELDAAQVELRDLTNQRDLSDAACRAAEARRSNLAAALDQRRATIAALETRVAALEARLEDSERAAAAAAKAAETERARLAAAVGEAEALLKRSEEAREAAMLENGRQLTRLAEREAALHETETALSKAEKARDELDERARALAAQRATLEGALGAQRAARAELLQEVDRLRASPAAAEGAAPDDRALRSAIARLGRQIARLNGKGPAVEAESAEIAGFERRKGRARVAAAGGGEGKRPATPALAGEDRPWASEG